MKRASIFSISIISVIVASVLFTYGCGNFFGKNSLSSPSPALPIVQVGQPASGRLFVRSKIILTDAEFSNSKLEKLKIESLGIILSEKDKSLILPKVPIAGRLIKIGSILTTTDTTGRFSIDSFPDSVSEVQILQLAEEPIPWLTFNVNKLGNDKNTPPEIIIEETQDFRTLLPNTRSIVPTPLPCADGRQTQGDCAAVNQCCKDYTSTERPCGSILGYSKQSVFWGSKCSEWFLKRVCLSPMYITPESCFNNHAGRFCQQINDDDFSITPQGEIIIGEGESVSLSLTNKTRKNETQLILDKNIGSLSSEYSIDPSTSNSIFLRHYKVVDAASENRKYCWLDIIDAKYTAPSLLPSGSNEEIVTVSYYAFPDSPKTLKIRIVKKPKFVVKGNFGFGYGDWNGKITDSVNKTTEFTDNWSDSAQGSVTKAVYGLGQPPADSRGIWVGGSVSSNISFNNSKLIYKVNNHEYSWYAWCGVGGHGLSTQCNIDFYVKGKPGTNFKLEGSLQGSDLPQQGTGPGYRVRIQGSNMESIDTGLNTSISINKTGVSGNEITVNGIVYSYACRINAGGEYGFGYSNIIQCPLVPWNTSVANLTLDVKVTPI
jgi:hypothetical protein